MWLTRWVGVCESAASDGDDRSAIVIGSAHGRDQLQEAAGWDTRDAEASRWLVVCEAVDGG